MAEAELKDPVFYAWTVRNYYAQPATLLDHWPSSWLRSFDSTRNFPCFNGLCEVPAPDPLETLSRIAWRAVSLSVTSVLILGIRPLNVTSRHARASGRCSSWFSQLWIQAVPMNLLWTMDSLDSKSSTGQLFSRIREITCFSRYFDGKRSGNPRRTNQTLPRYCVADY